MAAPGEDAQVLQVAEAVRLDRFLAETLGLSRREALALLAAGKVAWAGRVLAVQHKGLRLEPGSQLRVAAFETARSARVQPAPELPLTVLLERPGLVVLDKPANQDVFPHQPDETGTLLNAVVARYPGVQGVGEGGLRSGVVHRLDRDTSGALLVAIDAASWRRWRGAFAGHEVRKTYRALVGGRLGGAAREEVWLLVAQHRPARVRAVPAGTAGARRCMLTWRALETFAAPEASLLELELETGFLHQIRATLAHRGHPLLGDAHYGGPPLAPRQMLHAARLEFEDVAAESPDPPDFVALLEHLRRGSR